MSVKRYAYTEPRRFIGKCKACKTPRSALVSSLISSARMSYIETDSAAHYYCNGEAFVPCDCGRWVRMTEVRGKFSAKHQCNARCMSSTGPACECSCAGRNHGANFSC